MLAFIAVHNYHSTNIYANYPQTIRQLSKHFALYNPHSHLHLPVAVNVCVTGEVD
jgi:hypothetical protein